VERKSKELSGERRKLNLTLLSSHHGAVKTHRGKYKGEKSMKYFADWLWIYFLYREYLACINLFAVFNPFYII